LVSFISNKKVPQFLKICIRKKAIVQQRKRFTFVINNTVEKATDGKWRRMPGYGGGGKVRHLCRVADERRYRGREPRACRHIYNNDKPVL